MTEKLSVVRRYADKVGGLGGGCVSIRYFNEPGHIDFSVESSLTTKALLLTGAEAIMLAKALLGAAQPSEEDFWTGEDGQS